MGIPEQTIPRHTATTHQYLLTALRMQPQSAGRTPQKTSYRTWHSAKNVLPYVAFRIQPSMSANEKKANGLSRLEKHNVAASLLLGEKRENRPVC
jgi:hypothetical protein